MALLPVVLYRRYAIVSIRDSEQTCTQWYGEFTYSPPRSIELSPRKPLVVSVIHHGGTVRIVWDVLSSFWANFVCSTFTTHRWNPQRETFRLMCRATAKLIQPCAGWCRTWPLPLICYEAPPQPRRQTAHFAKSAAACMHGCLRMHRAFSVGVHGGAPVGGALRAR